MIGLQALPQVTPIKKDSYMDGVLPLEKDQFVHAVTIAHMMHKNVSNFYRKLHLIKKLRPDMTKRHCIMAGTAHKTRYSLDRIMTVVMMIDLRRLPEIDLLVSTLECLERSNNEEFVRQYILDFYKSIPNLRPDALPYSAN